MDTPLPLLIRPRADRDQAAALVEQFCLPVVSQLPESGFYLAFTEQGLELCQQGPEAPGPIRIDFVAGRLAHRRRFGGGRGQPLARAVGLKSAHKPRVLDATAGLGRDAFVLASLGCRIELCERSRVLAALLSDALQRAGGEREVANIVARMALQRLDSRDYLKTLSETERPDVIYLDPMYPASRSTARVKKDMAALHQLIGADTDSSELLDLARQTARKRVVVKRPAHAENLHRQTPDTCIESKNTRYDIYMVFDSK